MSIWASSSNNDSLTKIINSFQYLLLFEISDVERKRSGNSCGKSLNYFELIPKCTSPEKIGAV